MNITVDAKEFAAALAIAARVIPAKSPWPILQNVKIVTNDDRITVIGSDGDMTVEVDIPASIETDGACALPFAPLSTFSRAVKGGEVKIALADGKARVSAGRSRISLLAASVEDFPNYRPVEAEPIGMDPEAFCASLKFCLSATTDDESRWNMAGVNFSEHEGSVDLFGTEGRTMHRATLNGLASVGGGGTLPVAGAHVVAQIAEKAETVSFAITSNGWIIAAGNRRMWGKVVDGGFPDVRRVMGQFENWQEVFIASREDIDNAITFATCGADAGSDKARNLIVRAVDGEPVVIRGQRAIGGVDHAGRAEMEAVSRADFSAAVSSRYLSGAISGMQADEICVLTDSRDDGGVVVNIRPAQESATVSMSALIMALRASDAELKDV